MFIIEPKEMFITQLLFLKRFVLKGAKMVVWRIFPDGWFTGNETVKLATVHFVLFKRFEDILIKIQYFCGKK